MISPEYAALNREMHERKPQYGANGDRWASHADELARHIGAETVLDYGCGKGTFRAAIELLSPKYTVLEYDPAIPGKDTKPEAVDLVVCGDVLEHIEPDCLYYVLDDIRSIAQKAVFLVVSTVPAVKHLPDGRNAHLIVEPASWWLPKLESRWRTKSLQSADKGFVFVGKPL